MSQCEYFSKGECLIKFELPHEDRGCDYDVENRAIMEQGLCLEAARQRRESINMAIQCRRDDDLDIEYSPSRCDIRCGNHNPDNPTEKCATRESRCNWTMADLLLAEQDFIMLVLGYYGLRAKSQEARRAQWIHQNMIAIMSRGDRNEHRRI